jgi:hypothetical protein
MLTTPKLERNLMGNQTWSMMRKTRRRRKKEECNPKE